VSPSPGDLYRGRGRQPGDTQGCKSTRASLPACFADVSDISADTPAGSSAQPAATPIWKTSLRGFPDTSTRCVRPCSRSSDRTSTASSLTRWSSRPAPRSPSSRARPHGARRHEAHELAVPRLFLHVRGRQVPGVARPQLPAHPYKPPALHGRLEPRRHQGRRLPPRRQDRRCLCGRGHLHHPGPAHVSGRAEPGLAQRLGDPQGLVLGLYGFPGPGCEPLGRDCQALQRQHVGMAGLLAALAAGERSADTQVAENKRSPATIR